MFFDTWSDLARVVIVGSLAYLGLVITVRMSGKRTLSQMNAFDLIVTIALGSILATVLLSSEVSLAEGMLAFGLLIGLQLAISLLSVRVSAVRKLIQSEPSLLLFEGEFLHDALTRERVTRNAVVAALREQGLAAQKDAYAVVLETNGKLAVIPFSNLGAGSTTLDEIRKTP
jgi:uncharacterized membrane protein YcaP (DUF421 family)